MVKEISEGWVLEIGSVDSKLTRVFIDDGSSSIGSYKGSVPKIGERYSESSPGGFNLKGLFVDRIIAKKIGGHPHKTHITVIYNTRLNASDARNERSWERSMTMGGEVISIKNEEVGIYKWGSADGELINQNIPKLVSTGGFSITRRSLRSSISTTLFSLIGKINASSFERFPKDTVLFEGINSIQYVDDEGDIKFRISFNFKYRFPSWNHLLRESTGEMTVVYPPLYEEGDLHILLGDSIV